MSSSIFQPTAVVTVTNGRLPESTMERIKAFVEEHIDGVEKYEMVRHSPRERKLSDVQKRALRLIDDLGDGAFHPDYVAPNTIYSLRRRGLVTGCFEPLALTDDGKKAIGVGA